MFEANNPSVKSAHKSLSKRFRSIKGLFPVYDQYLASYNDITTNTKENPKEDILMIVRVYGTMNKIKKVKGMLLYQQKLGDIVYEYVRLDTYK